MGDWVKAAFGVSCLCLVGSVSGDGFFRAKKWRPACPDEFWGSKKWRPGCRDGFGSDAKWRPGWPDGLAGSAKRHPGTGDDPTLVAELRPGRGNDFLASAQLRPGTADGFGRRTKEQPGERAAGVRAGVRGCAEFFLQGACSYLPTRKAFTGSRSISENFSDRHSACSAAHDPKFTEHGTRTTLLTSPRPAPCLRIGLCRRCG